MRVAIIGSGIAGLGAAWQLRHNADVTVFEKNARIGGHSHTVTASDEVGVQIPIDTGFIVYNLATYPNLVALFAALRVETIASDMSFAASLDRGRAEYSGDNLRSLIGHWQNLFRPRHWRMMIDLVRFLKNGSRLSLAPADMTLGAYLDRHGYSTAFMNDHLLPMAGAIWSAAPRDIFDFPARSFGDFFRNHGLLELDTKKRPQWRTVAGGSRTYVEALAQESGADIITNAMIEKVAGSAVHMQDGTVQDFDHIIIATHADEAAALLQDNDMRAVLKSFRYSANDAYLHKDSALMPSRRNLWASWNYMRQEDVGGSGIFVSYWMNRLQKLDTKTDFFVSLNPAMLPAADKTVLHQVYHHPQFDLATLAAQERLREVQGKDNIWLCGSYCGFGFHEDALASGLAVAEALGAKRVWSVTDVSPAFINATPI